LFGGRVGRPKARPYQLRFAIGGKRLRKSEDPYRFPPLLGEIDIHLLAEGHIGTHTRNLGPISHRIDGVSGVGFAFGPECSPR